MHEVLVRFAAFVFCFCSDTRDAALKVNSKIEKQTVSM